MSDTVDAVSTLTFGVLCYLLLCSSRRERIVKFLQSNPVQVHKASSLYDGLLLYARVKTGLGQDSRLELNPIQVHQGSSLHDGLLLYATVKTGLDLSKSYTQEYQGSSLRDDHLYMPVKSGLGEV